MIRKIDPESSVSKSIFADPTPLGYIGLAVSCAAQMPIAFGAALMPLGLLALWIAFGTLINPTVGRRRYRYA